MNTSSTPVPSSDEMKGLMSALLDAVIFEQWVRFSSESRKMRDGDFCIQIPEATVRELEEDYPDYKSLLGQLNGTIVDATMACSAVLGYARSALGEQSMAALEHPEFQSMVGRFHQWLHDNVDKLEQEPFNFDRVVPDVPRIHAGRERGGSCVSGR